MSEMDYEEKGHGWSISVGEDGYGAVDLYGVLHHLKFYSTGVGASRNDQWPLMAELDGAERHPVTALMTQDHVDALYEFLHGLVTPDEDRMVGPERGWRFGCEAHDEPGACTAECAEIMSLMTAPMPDDRPYDPTGCSDPEKVRRTEVRLKDGACQMRQVIDWSHGVTTLEVD